MLLKAVAMEVSLYNFTLSIKTKSMNILHQLFFSRNNQRVIFFNAEHSMHKLALKLHLRSVTLYLYVEINQTS